MIDFEIPQELHTAYREYGYWIDEDGYIIRFWNCEGKLRQDLQEDRRFKARGKYSERNGYIHGERNDSPASLRNEIFKALQHYKPLIPIFERIKALMQAHPAEPQIWIPLIDELIDRYHDFMIADFLDSANAAHIPQLLIFLAEAEAWGSLKINSKLEELQRITTGLNTKTYNTILEIRKTLEALDAKDKEDRAALAKSKRDLDQAIKERSQLLEHERQLEEARIRFIQEGERRKERERIMQTAQPILDQLEAYKQAQLDHEKALNKAKITMACFQAKQGRKAQLAREREEYLAMTKLPMTVTEAMQLLIDEGESYEDFYSRKWDLLTLIRDADKKIQMKDWEINNAINHQIAIIKATRRWEAEFGTTR